MMKTVLAAEGVGVSHGAGAVEFVSSYWIGASGRCNGKITTCTESEISGLIGDLQGVANSAGITYLQVRTHVRTCTTAGAVGLYEKERNKCQYLTYWSNKCDLDIWTEKMRVFAACRWAILERTG
jgi:hypothetical protein